MSLLLAAALAAAQARDSLAVYEPAQARDSLGIYERWGAFRDAAPARCFAIARPVPPVAAAFASIASWPISGIRNQFAARASRPLRAGARPSLAIGDRRFALIGRGDLLWAPDTRTDAAIVAAMRAARSMSVEGVDAAGRPFADTYALRGAATAIDAAALGCARR